MEVQKALSCVNIWVSGSSCSLCSWSFESPCNICQSGHWYCGWWETNRWGIFAESSSSYCCTWSSSHWSSWFHQWEVPLRTLMHLICCSTCSVVEDMRMTTVFGEHFLQISIWLELKFSIQHILTMFDEHTCFSQDQPSGLWQLLICLQNNIGSNQQ